MTAALVGRPERRRGLCSCIALLLLVLFPSGGMAQCNPPADGRAYVLITTPQELMNIQSNLSGNYFLCNDLDLSTLSNTLPLGPSPAQPFRGYFDGNNKTIHSLSLASPSTNYVGLFGVLSGATIKRLSLSNVSVTGRSFVGGIAGSVRNSILSKLSVEGEVIGQSSAVTEDGTVIGGLVGDINTSTVVEASLTATVSGRAIVGGVFGSTANSTITQVHVTGALITAPGGGSIYGGLVGSSRATFIAQSSAIMSISLLASNQGVVGGFLGEGSEVLIADCFARGSIHSPTGSQSAAAGFASVLRDGSIVDRNYVAIELDTPQPNYGFVGFVDDLTSIANSYWDSDVSGAQLGIGGTPKETIELTAIFGRPRNVFEAWEFYHPRANPTGIWIQIAQVNNGYPFISNSAFVDLRDCNQSESADIDDIVRGSSFDCDLNLVPDECEVDLHHANGLTGDGHGVCSLNIEDIVEDGSAFLILGGASRVSDGQYLWIGRGTQTKGRPDRGYIEWNVSNLPLSSLTIIRSTKLLHDGGYQVDSQVRRLLFQPSQTTDNASLYNTIGFSPEYSTPTAFPVVGGRIVELGALANYDLQNQLANGWFAIGLTSSNEMLSSLSWINSSEYPEASSRPRLLVSYTPYPLCGNGYIESNEYCDDRNRISSDGCSSSCIVEAGYACQHEPSACTGPTVPSGDLSGGERMLQRAVTVWSATIRQ